MKKIVLTLVCFVLILSFVSCSNMYEDIITSDINYYENIWSRSRRAGEPSMLFPSTVAKEQCVNFYFNYQDIILAPSWQIFLKNQYDEETFLSEFNHLNTICENSPVCGDSEYFDTQVYATVWNWNGCFEYAIVDEEEKTVSYIYIQLINKEDLMIDEEYIPEGYEMEMENSVIYSVYE